MSGCTRFKYKQQYSRKILRKAVETALHSELPSLFGVVAKGWGSQEIPTGP